MCAFHYLLNTTPFDYLVVADSRNIVHRPYNCIGTPTGDEKVMSLFTVLDPFGEQYSGEQYIFFLLLTMY
jgi:hypothetical protein